VSDKFPFRRPGWRKHTQIERSIFSDEALERAIWDVAEDATAELNGFLRDFLDTPCDSRPAALHRLRALRRLHEAGLGARDPVRFSAAFRAAEREARGTSYPARALALARRALGRLRTMARPAATGTVEAPRLIESLKGYDIVFYKGVYYGLPRSLGPVRLDSHEAKRLPGVIDGTTPESVRDAIVALP
jgi:hypothetical protein